MHRGLDDGVIVVKSGSTVLLDLFGQDQCDAHKDAGQSYQAQNGVEPEGLVDEREHIGTTPTRPSGAVSMTMDIVEKDRTCSMMTINMTAIMAGKTLASAVLAFSASSIDPRSSMR
ncbi:hypothetical protein AJ87_47255 [Rhizobium yanglingense]|nr:hypothetical protein AJ87_47255 [Rhizobium yanglingense]